MNVSYSDTGFRNTLNPSCCFKMYHPALTQIIKAATTGTNALRLRHHTHGSPTVPLLTVWCILPHKRQELAEIASSNLEESQCLLQDTRLIQWELLRKKETSKLLASIKDIQRFVWSTLAANTLAEHQLKCILILSYDNNGNII